MLTNYKYLHLQGIISSICILYLSDEDPHPIATIIL